MSKGCGIGVAAMGPGSKATVVRALCMGMAKACVIDAAATGPGSMGRDGTFAFGHVPYPTWGVLGWGQEPFSTCGQFGRGMDKLVLAMRKA